MYVSMNKTAHRIVQVWELQPTQMTPCSGYHDGGLIVSMDRESLRQLRPDLKLPEPGQCIQVPEVDIRDALIRKLVGALQRAKQSVHTHNIDKHRVIDTALAEAAKLGYGAATPGKKE
jgi:hypothetical protein